MNNLQQIQLYISFISFYVFIGFSNYKKIRSFYTFDLNKTYISGEGAYSSVYKVKRLSDHIEYALKQVKILKLSEKEK